MTQDDEEEKTPEKTKASPIIEKKFNN